MKIFFDHYVPKRLMRHLVPEHEGWTAYQKRWHEKKNGELLSLVEGEFDVFLTADQNIKHQQNLSRRSLKFIVLVASDNGYETLSPLIPKVTDALTKISPGEFVEIS